MARNNTEPDAILAGLNDEQRAAVQHGEDPLLIIAGAGTGKTRTLVHRVAWAIREGVDPSRILLLTFTRRAAAEMLRRVDGLLRSLDDQGMRGAGRRTWGGTFHATATRLLRLHGRAIGLDPGFTIHDRGDSEDLMNVVRTELDLARTDKRFPRKGTCMSIYSHCVNAQRPIEEVLEEHYPWCDDYEGELKALFRGYVDRKEAASILDYDDLLLFWHGLLLDDEAAKRVRERFDRVFVDEYQDTNRLQSDLLARLVPGGRGLTVVGDDAQSIYSFRAATVRNILDFPKAFTAARVIKLEQNYRSTATILDVTNAVISDAMERWEKDLWTARAGGDRPLLVTCRDEYEQAEWVAERVLARREEGVDLKAQAVLFRAGHHSIALEAELARRNVPFVKYGGLKFVETAHVKDLTSFLRLAENPTDLVSGSRVLQLLPGVGPKRARALMDRLRDAGGDFAAWKGARMPPACEALWPELLKLMRRLRKDGAGPQAQVNAVRRFYGPILEDTYDTAAPRLRDLEQIEQLAGRFADRASFLADITLEPPSSTEDFAGPPLLDEDYLILSTIHSAKGLEWDSVFVLHAADGNIPSDMATGSTEQIDEERRLFYVALTRAKSHLYVCFPQRYYTGPRAGRGDDHTFAQLTRFVTARVRRLCDAVNAGVVGVDDGGDGGDGGEPGAAQRLKQIRDRARSMWS